VTEVVELREEVTWVHVAVIMARARAAWAERMAHEKAILLASAHGEADVVARKISLLEGELAVALQVRDTTEVKLLGLVGQVAIADR
jgi:heterodisulfide reductase subunit A-like polyferredoxin